MALLAPRKYRDKLCETCGTEYTPTGANQKWCSPACRDGETVETPAVATASGAHSEPQPLARPGLDPELYDWVKEAVSANASALGSGYEDGWRSTSWTFAQVLRDHPALITLDADEAADVIEPYLDALFPAIEWNAGPEGTWDPWSRNLDRYDSGGNEMDPLEDFLRVWPLVRAPAIKVALAHADSPPYQGPEVFGSALAAPRRAPFRRFLAVCRELCRVAAERGGDGVAALPVQALATALGTDRRTCGGWRQEAVRRGFLVEVRPPTKHGGPAGRAGEYRWIAEERERRAYEPAPVRPGRHPAQRRGSDDEPGF